MVLPDSDWRVAVGRVIGDHDAFAADLAVHLEEPYEDLRATVRLWLLLHGVPATIPELEAATDRLRRRAWTPQRSRPDLMAATTLDELYDLDAPRARGPALRP